MLNPVISWIDPLRRMCTELIAEHIRVKTQLMFNDGEILLLKLQLRQSISKDLAELTKDLRASIAAQPSTITNWQGIANDLRESVADSVRSISHKLWGQQPVTPVPDLTPLQITRIMFSSLIQRKDVLDEVESKIEASMIQALSSEQLTLRFSKDLAKYLHGNLQSRLMAIAFAIEASGATSDHAELSAQLELARQVLAMPFDQYFEIVPNSFTVEIKKLTDNWSPLLLTSLVFSGSDEQFSTAESSATILCIEEGLANAHHHGCADEVVITVSTTKDTHAISLIDNGIGPRAGDPGLGSMLFNSIAGSNWSLSKGPEGIGAKLNLQINK